MTTGTTPWRRPARPTIDRPPAATRRRRRCRGRRLHRGDQPPRPRPGERGDRQICRRRHPDRGRYRARRRLRVPRGHARTDARGPPRAGGGLRDNEVPRRPVDSGPWYRAVRGSDRRADSRCPTLRRPRPPRGGQRRAPGRGRAVDPRGDDGVPTTGASPSRCPDFRASPTPRTWNRSLPSPACGWNTSRSTARWPTRTPS